MSNILSDIDSILDMSNPYAIAKNIAEKLRERRLEKNLSQQSLASMSGVSLGSLKRFENCYEISLKSLLLLAVSLEATEEFQLLFSKRQYESIDDILNGNTQKKRQRGKRNG
ncbi:MAG: helix-turn-helix transcriptional regulator [Bacteroidetes bacterium]|nr:helix-turn-helix transcriptional regulator [Bacteroidota bacterium]